MEYAYRQIELTKYGIGDNSTGVGSSAVTYSPIPTGNGSDVTVPLEPDGAVSTMYKFQKFMYNFGNSSC